MEQQANEATALSEQYQEQEKYILFGLGGETYGIHILQAQEIIADFELTVLPSLPEFFHGVISLRGEAIPVINLRRRFGLPDRDRDGFTRVIIVELEETSIGIQVDTVFRVASIFADAIDAPPTLTYGQKTKFIRGVAELGRNKFSIILDIEEILTRLEKIELESTKQFIEEKIDPLTGDVASEPETDESNSNPTVKNNTADPAKSKKNRNKKSRDRKAKNKVETAVTSVEEQVAEKTTNVEDNASEKKVENPPDSSDGDNDN